MKVILRFLIIVGIFCFSPAVLHSQTPGTKVEGSSDIYYGTKSNREVNGLPTWNYYQHNKNDTDFDTSPYEDFFFQRNWESTPTNFRFLFPPQYDNSNEDEEYPLIIMLHGLGEGGGRGILGNGYTNYVPGSTTYNENFYLNNNHQLKNGGKIHLEVNQGIDTRGPNGTSREFPGFIMFPQTVTSTHNNQTPGWANLEVVIKLIEDVIKTFPVDLNRIYVHGLSNGGNNTWKLVEMRPDLFAAYLPMAGHPQSIDLTKISHIPLWLFQGGADKTATALPTQARAAIEQLKDLGANPRYTEYPGVGHNAWDPAYKEPDFFSWMLGQSKTNIQVENGRTAYCEDSPFSVRLQVDPNFSNYQWKKNGVIIPGATQAFYEATEYATYEASFLRSGSTVGEWSDPVEITVQALTEPVQIVAQGSTTLPGLDGANSVTLSAPEGYAAYDWQNSSATTREISVSSAGVYRVSVTEEDGCASNYSPAITVSVNGPTDAIIAPSKLAGEAVSSSRINLFWQDNSENENGFEIYRSLQPGGPYKFISKTKSNVVYFGDGNLAASTDYYYIVRAVNDVGSSPATAELSISTGGDLTNPSRPQNLVASANLDLSSITLTWERSKDDVEVSGYTVYRVEGGNLNEIGTTSDTTYISSGLTKDANYTYVVKATDTSGKISEQSNQASATTIFCGLQYDLYANFIYDVVGDIGVSPAEWKGSGRMENFSLHPGEEYYVERDEPITYFGIIYEGYIYLEKGTYKFNTRSDDGSTLSIDGQLVVSNDKRQSATTVEGTFIAESSKAYRITVKYFNAGGSYEFSVKYKTPGSDAFVSIPDEILCSTVGAPSPSIPNVPLSFAAEAVSESKINLSWTPDGDATGFEIYRSKSGVNNYELITTLGPTATSYTDADLESETTYYYKAKSINTNGGSEFTDESGKLIYRYYEKVTAFSNVAQLPTLPLIETGTINNFEIKLAKRNYNYGFIFDGKILIETPGIYTFYTTSDDGSKLYINGSEVVKNDGPHGAQTRSGTYTFGSPGLHDISVWYFENTGNVDVLEVKYKKSTETTEKSIPDSHLNSSVVYATTLGDGEAPTAPQDLTLKSVSNSSVGLSWLPSTDNVGVVGYQIFNVPSTGAPTYIAQTDTLGIVVDNINEDVDEESNSINFINASFGEVSGQNSGVGMSILSENAVSRVSTSIGGLTHGTDYNFMVKAIDAAGNLSAASNVVPFTTRDESILPIELVDFFAIPKENHVELTWITASETNNDYFVVLRSLDGKDFKEVGTVDGSGDSHEMLYYNFNDEQPVTGIMYYQLKQVDTNGVFSTSRIINVDYKKDQGIFDLKIYPNPVKNYDFKVALSSSNKESKVHLKITDMLGKVYLSKIYNAEELLNTLQMSKSGLSGGIYIMSVQQADRILQRKIIIE